MSPHPRSATHLYVVTSCSSTLCLSTNSKMLKLCGETEEKLAQELIQFEFQIERDVVDPLYVLAEVSQQWYHLMKNSKWF